MTKDQTDAQKTAFIEQLIITSGKYNWQQGLAEQSCCALGLAPKHYMLWFPSGLPEIVTYLEAQADQDMATKFVRESQSISQAIIELLTMRLLCPSISVQLARCNLKYYTLLSHFFLGSKLRFQTADMMWRCVRDKSLDWRFYSKRISLQCIYAYLQKEIMILEHNNPEVLIHTTVRNWVNKISKFKQFTTF